MSERPAREPYLDVADVAAWLKLKPSTVRAAAAARRLPATRVNGVWRFLESELRAFLDRHHTRAGQQLAVVPRRTRADVGRQTGRRFLVIDDAASPAAGRGRSPKTQRAAVPR